MYLLRRACSGTVPSQTAHFKRTRHLGLVLDRLHHLQLLCLGRLRNRFRGLLAGLVLQIYSCCVLEQRSNVYGLPCKLGVGQLRFQLV